MTRMMGVLEREEREVNGSNDVDEVARKNGSGTSRLFGGINFVLFAEGTFVQKPGFSKGSRKGH